jgi:hypothetical protein
MLYWRIIVAITSELIGNFRRDFAECVSQLEKFYNIKISIGNISYNEAEFHTRMDVTALSESGSALVNPAEEHAARAYLRLHDVPIKSKTIIGTEVLLSGKPAKVIKFDMKKRKYPFIVEQNGQRFKCSHAILTFETHF